MYRISEMASISGISRTAILYYEKLGLITSKRLENGYRAFGERDLQQLRLIQQLHNGGLTLSECKSCLESKLDKSVLNSRYLTLQTEIKQKQRSLKLLEGLLGKSTSKSWHETLSDIAPDAHLDWLKTQGYDEKQALRIKWLSKDMNEHDQYMQDFLSIFEVLESWGPSSKVDTTKAFRRLKQSPESILEIGCGNGNSTMTLANLTSAPIVATDNEQSALIRLKAKIDLQALGDRVSTQCVSMTALPFGEGSFDLIWAEASIYIMGVEKALLSWKPLLKSNGALVFSDLVWLTDSPSDEIREFWKGEYPDMQNIDTRLNQIVEAGYQVDESFTVSEASWKDYYQPLQERLNDLKGEMGSTPAFLDIQHEVNLYKKYLGQFGYQFFIAHKN